MKLVYLIVTKLKKSWLDSNKELHREEGPAYLNRETLFAEWWEHGKSKKAGYMSKKIYNMDANRFE